MGGRPFGGGGLGGALRCVILLVSDDITSFVPSSPSGASLSSMV